MINERLKIFMMAAELENFTKTASSLGMTQPNVTHQIRLLERELKATLFIRDGRSIRLTPAGQTLKKEATMLFSTEQHLRQQVYNAAHKVKNYLIGGTMTAGAYLLPKMLKSFLNKSKNVTLSLHLSNTKEIIEHLKRGHLSLALIEGPFDRDLFMWKKCCDDELVFVQAPNRPPPISMTNYLNSGGRMLLRESGSGTRFYFDHYIKNLKIDSNWQDKVVESASFEVIKELSITGFGATFISKLAVQNELETKKLIICPLNEGKMMREINFIYLAESAKFAEDFIRKNHHIKGIS